MVNGGPKGFFSMERGLKQGDPLSPILFVLMEEVLSRGLTKLVETGKIQPMVIRKNIYPTHLFFADDVFSFSNGSKKSLNSLLSLLKCYQDSSGQLINKQKSKCFVDGCTPLRKDQIKNVLQMELTSFPDKYLGVILNPGRAKSCTVWPMVEMMQIYLAVWKGKFLSFHDRLVLIKSVLCSIPIYNMAVYKWPSSIIKICERIIRNFLWTVDSEERKYDTLKWNKVCTPYNEGGLGIRRLMVINKALLMKMMWKLLTSEVDWAKFFTAKYKNKNGVWCTQWKLSSIWPGLKWAWMELKNNIRWCIGDGSKISVWFDTWIRDKPLIESFGSNDTVQNYIYLKVQDLLIDGEWRIPFVLQDIIPPSLPSVSVGKDLVAWCGDVKGIFTTAAAIEKIRAKEPKVHWPSQIWKPFLHPWIASNIWKIQQGAYMDDEKRIAQGYSLASKCCICQHDQDSMNHLLWRCNFSTHIWQWLVQIFNFQVPSSFTDILQFSKHKSPFVNQVWIIASCAIVRELWFHKNKTFHEGTTPNLLNFKRIIMSMVFYGSYRITGAKWMADYDSNIIYFFKIEQRNISNYSNKVCQWDKPKWGYILFCCEGIAIGNPGTTGYGVIARDHHCQVISTISGGVGVATNFIDKVLSIVCAIEWAVKNQCSKIIIRLADKSVIENFNNAAIPWYLRNRWLKAIRKLADIQYEDCYKEVNFSAESLARQGAGLA
ncbi:uncharacterized protein LOC113350687 [Papaver somniferum]|uniref:uncharacterized protein LOC113350687 n=1 Tax=Papaver somniferum TaxID=3469 RepID=UPI000E6FF45E|nr:uncharacterized protein LOC113350687 [Papaver somniferum]